jgi:hypothetical protein
MRILQLTKQVLPHQDLFNNHTHIGNLGAPTGPPINPLTGLELSKVSKTQ